jgi:hypothetical protein
MTTSTPSKTAIPVGPASKAGLVISILTLIAPLATQIVALVENTSAQWTTADKTSLIVGGAVAAVTLLGRFAQAVAQIIKGG